MLAIHPKEALPFYAPDAEKRAMEEKDNFLLQLKEKYPGYRFEVKLVCHTPEWARLHGMEGNGPDLEMPEPDCWLVAKGTSRDPLLA